MLLRRVRGINVASGVSGKVMEVYRRPGNVWVEPTSR